MVVKCWAPFDEGATPLHVGLRISARESKPALYPSSGGLMNETYHPISRRWVLTVQAPAKLLCTEPAGGSSRRLRGGLVHRSNVVSKSIVHSQSEVGARFFPRVGIGFNPKLNDHNRIERGSAGLLPRLGEPLCGAQHLGEEPRDETPQSLAHDLRPAVAIGGWSALRRTTVLSPTESTCPVQRRYGCKQDRRHHDGRLLGGGRKLPVEPHWKLQIERIG
jgi:hypothetical protein